MPLLGLNQRFGGWISPASCLAVPWLTVSGHQACDFSVRSPVAAFGRGTGYSALSKARKTWACRVLERDGLLTIPLRQVFPKKKIKITLPKEHWLIKTLTTTVACCIILFDFYKSRAILVANVFRLAPSAWGQSGEHAPRLPSPSAVAWMLPWWGYLSIAPDWKGGCTCFILFSMKTLVINQPCYICKGNLEHREILLILNYILFSSCSIAFETKTGSIFMYFFWVLHNYLLSMTNALLRLCYLH